ncbi:MAG: hypothetical protein KatS3mg027_2280 [Bacteroidia bacterium]|nr:MAG: hypothetical protein KatS3mg027_2280 [Bacteroidia bacterium]
MQYKLKYSKEIALDALHPRNDGIVLYSYNYPSTCGTVKKNFLKLAVIDNAQHLRNA